MKHFTDTLQFWLGWQVLCLHRRRHLRMAVRREWLHDSRWPPNGHSWVGWKRVYS